MNTTDAIFDLQQICLLLLCAMVCLVFQMILSLLLIVIFYIFGICDFLKLSTQSFCLFSTPQILHCLLFFPFPCRLGRLTEGFLVVMFWVLIGVISKTSFSGEMLSLIDKYWWIDGCIRWRFIWSPCCDSIWSVLVFIGFQNAFCLYFSFPELFNFRSTRCYWCGVCSFQRIWFRVVVFNIFGEYLSVYP